MLYNRQIIPKYNPDKYPGGSKPSWVSIAKVYPPQDIVISGMLRSYGIPVKILRREIPQLPVSIGPLGEVEIFVPDHLSTEAKDLIEKTVEE